MDIYTVSRFLGHADIRTSMIYAKAKVDTLRDAVMKYLKENGIQTGVHYRPTYHYPLYKGFFRENDCKNVELFFNNELTLPLHLEVTSEDVERICMTIKEVL